MYNVIKIKNELIRKQVFALIVFSFSFAFVLSLFSKSLQTPVSFKVDIVDEDKTQLSKKAVFAITNLSGVSITALNPDVKYTIKEGFEDNFLKGNFSELIKVDKTSFKRGISLLNDRIVTKLVSDYIYLNLYERIKLIKDISFTEYEKSLDKTKLDNEILLLNINDGNITDKSVTDIDYTSYIALFFMVLICGNIGLKGVFELNQMRNNGVLYRLRLCGIGVIRVISIEFVSTLIKSTLALYPFIFFRFDIKIFLIGIPLVIINYIINILLEKIAGSEETLVFISRSVMIIFLGVALVLNFYY